MHKAMLLFVNLYKIYVEIEKSLSNFGSVLDNLILSLQSENEYNWSLYRMDSFDTRQVRDIGL